MYSILQDLQQLDRLASLNHTIPIAADPTPVNVDYGAHTMGPQCVLESNYDDPPALTEVILFSAQFHVSCPYRSFCLTMLTHYFLSGTDF